MEPRDIRLEAEILIKSSELIKNIESETNIIGSKSSTVRVKKREKL
jgi:hypothetical protein